MLGLSKPNDLPLTLGNVMSNIGSGVSGSKHPEIMQHHEDSTLLLNCRPTLGILVINTLSASDYVLIPMQAEYFAAEDMMELTGTVQGV